MKKLVVFILLLASIQVAQAQETDSITFVDGHNIVGRWMEEGRYNIAKDTAETTQPYTYIFKADQTFHRGEVSEGVIFFNVTGKYTLEGNDIEINYYEYVGQGATGFRKRRMGIRIETITDSTMDVIADESHSESYQLQLKRLSPQ